MTMQASEPVQSPQPEKIRSMFAKVAANYDLANSVLSLGVHHLWRKNLVRKSGAQPGDSVLDCATGTGDLAIEFKRHVGSSGQVTGTDFCEEMLRPAPCKARDRKLDIRFETADVTALQYPDNSFDVVSISFGIRNVADPLKALQEMARVTKPGGRVMVLEFGQVTLPGFDRLYSFYSTQVLPIIGGLVTGQRQAYDYLQKSSANFPCRESFIQLMQQTSQFSSSEYFPLTGGVAYIYRGTKKTS